MRWLSANCEFLLECAVPMTILVVVWFFWGSSWLTDPVLAPVSPRVFSVERIYSVAGHDPVIAMFWDDDLVCVAHPNDLTNWIPVAHVRDEERTLLPPEQENP